MTFGVAIKHLLAINDLKISNLASFLSYDISYISKWISGSKLPSAESAEVVCGKIAAYAASHSTAAKRAEAAEALSLSATEDERFEEVLSSRLYEILLEQKIAADHSYPAGGNASVVAETSEPLADDLANEIIEICHSRRSPQAEGILCMLASCLDTDHMGIINRIYVLNGGKNSLHIRQLISKRDFDNVNQYVRYICQHLSLDHPITVDYYDAGEDCPSPFFVIKNGFVVQRIQSPLGEQRFSLVTHDPAIVSKYYGDADAYLKAMTPMTERVSPNRIMDMALPYSYALQGQNCCIMRTMDPVHLSSELLEEFLDKYLGNPSQREDQRKLHEFTHTSTHSIITYKACLIDYMNNGFIQLFGRVVQLSREDRQRHLTHLIEEMEAGDKVSLKIMDDRNPLLDYHNNLLTIYMNENATFAVNSAQRAVSSIINFISPSLCHDLNEFYSHLESMPDMFLKRDKRAIDYIFGGIKMI